MRRWLSTGLNSASRLQVPTASRNSSPPFSPKRSSRPGRHILTYKRHIAVDTPSVYGRYKERELRPALSLTFRLENLARYSIRETRETVNRHLYDPIHLLEHLAPPAPVYAGAANRRHHLEAARHLSLPARTQFPEVRRFSYTQYLDTSVASGRGEGCHLRQLHQYPPEQSCRCSLFLGLVEKSPAQV